MVISGLGMPSVEFSNTQTNSSLAAFFTLQNRQEVQKSKYVL